MNPKEWITIPGLPCVSLDETMTFWKHLGFEQTYFQKSPYPYGVVARGGYEIHFVGIKGFDPTKNYAGCLVMVSDIEGVYQEFAVSLRKNVGKVPHSGLPRISRIRPGQKRFTVTDPSGNSVIFIKFGEEDAEVYDTPNQPGITHLQKAIANAVRFRDYKNDDAAAAKVLDVALERAQGETPVDIAAALLMRAELASDLDDAARAQACYDALKQMSLTAAEMEQVKHKLKITDDVEALFSPSD